MNYLLVKTGYENGFCFPMDKAKDLMELLTDVERYLPRYGQAMVVPFTMDTLEMQLIGEDTYKEMKLRATVNGSED